MVYSYWSTNEKACMNFDFLCLSRFVFYIQGTHKVQSGMGEWRIPTWGRSGGCGKLYGCPSYFRHIIQARITLLTACQPFNTQYLSLKLARVSLIPECMFSTWTWLINNRTNSLLEGKRIGVLQSEDIRALQIRPLHRISFCSSRKSGIVPQSGSSEY